MVMQELLRSWRGVGIIKKKITQVSIPTLLKNEIEYYIKKNGKYSNFDEFLILLLKHGLQSEILGYMSRLEKSYRCKDLNPKIVRRVYEFHGNKEESFLCKKHASDPIFDKYESEENKV